MSAPPPSISISKNGIKNNNITIGQEKLTLIAVLLMCGYIGFQIWAMSVANKARKDIKAEEQRIEQEFNELPVEWLEHYLIDFDLWCKSYRRTVMPAYFV